MKSEYDIELLSNIEKRGISSKVKIHEEVDNVIGYIETKFVMGYNGIDWSKNKVIFSQYFNSDFSFHLDEITKFLKKIGETFPHILNETILIIGDSLSNLSYEMQYKEYLRVFDLFLYIPQHTYIWFTNSQKCINFTFENEVYFG